MSAGTVKRLTLNGQTLDRRAFLGAMGLTTGAVLAGQFVPGMVGRAWAASPSSDMSAAHVTDAGWHVDDMWGHWPRYAHPIPYARAEVASVSWENVEPVDLMFMT